MAAAERRDAGSKAPVVSRPALFAPRATDLGWQLVRPVTGASGQDGGMLVERLLADLLTGDEDGERERPS